MDGFVIYREIADKIELLSDAQAGELLKMALAFAFDGEIVHTDDLAVNIVFTDMKRDIFRAAEKYQRICERNRENGAKGGRPKTQESPEEPKETQWDNLETQENQKNPNTEHRTQNIEHRTQNTEHRTQNTERVSRFAPPTVEDVKDYAWENGYKIDAERFVDFYTSKGWMVGKSKMKDWKAAVRNWAARDKKEALPFEDLDAGDFKVWEAI